MREGDKDNEVDHEIRSLNIQYDIPRTSEPTEVYFASLPSFNTDLISSALVCKAKLELGQQRQFQKSRELELKETISHLKSQEQKLKAQHTELRLEHRQLSLTAEETRSVQQEEYLNLKTKAEELCELLLKAKEEKKKSEQKWERLTGRAESENERLRGEMRRASEQREEEQKRRYVVDLEGFYRGVFEKERLGRAEVEERDLVLGGATMDVATGFQVLPVLT